MIRKTRYCVKCGQEQGCSWVPVDHPENPEHCILHSFDNGLCDGCGLEVTLETTGWWPSLEAQEKAVAKIEVVLIQ